MKVTKRQISKFNRVCKKLEKRKIPCDVKLENDGTINIVLGMWFPDSICDRAFRVLESCKVEQKDYCVCGDLGSSDVVESKRVYGGKKSW